MASETSAELMDAARRGGLKVDPTITVRIDAAVFATSDRAELGRLHVARAIATQGCGDTTESAESACLAVPHLLAAGLTSYAAYASALAAVFLDQTGDQNRAIEYAVDSMILVADSDDSDVESVRASLALGGFFSRLSSIELAVENSRRAFEGAQRTTGIPIDASAYTFGYISAEAGHMTTDDAARDRYLRHAHDAASWLQTNGMSAVSTHLLASGLFGEIALASGAEAQRKELDAATTLYDEATPDFVAWHRLVRGMVARRSGDAATAIGLLDLAIPGLVASSDNHCLVRALSERAEASAARGDLAGAYADSRRLAGLVRTWQIDQVGRLAEQLARRAELERSTSELKAVAEQLTADLDYDVTTGARSRRWLEEYLTSLAGSGEHGSMLMIDIDSFKVINDTHGHNIGDEALACFGALVTATAGDEGHVARFGGEEFLVITEASDPADGAQLAEQIRLAVVGYDWHVVAPGIELTTSVGVATGPLSTARDMLIRSDEALLEAKRQGRNRTVVSSSSDQFDTAALAGDRASSV